MISRPYKAYATTIDKEKLKPIMCNPIYDPLLIFIGVVALINASGLNPIANWWWGKGMGLKVMSALQIGAVGLGLGSKYLLGVCK